MQLTSAQQAAVMRIWRNHPMHCMEVNGGEDIFSKDTLAQLFRIAQGAEIPPSEGSALVGAILSIYHRFEELTVEQREHEKNLVINIANKYGK